MSFLSFQEYNYNLEDSPNNGYSRFPSNGNANSVPRDYMQTFYDKNTATWETHL